jgi:hypothetical protein
MGNVSLVPYHLVFCQKKQENLCVFAPLREAIWVAGIARVSVTIEEYHRYNPDALNFARANTRANFSADDAGL